MGETKLEQLLPLTFLLTLFCKRKLPAFLLTLFSFLLLTTTAFVLEHRIRRRYLASSGLILFVCMGFTLAQLRLRILIKTILLLFLSLDTWAYFYAWAETRHSQMGAAQASTLPKPPQYWLDQYTPIPDRLLRDLSLYGAQELVQMAKEQGSMATIPLRDARDRALMAYTQIYGGEHIILDSKKCCRENKKQCAQRHMTELQQAGFTLLLPKEIPLVQRIDKQQIEWLEEIKTYTDENRKEEGEYWWFFRSKDQGGHTPCQSLKKP